ncbi:MAG TPA: hypothetical protein H9903_05530 [Candidatus Aquabacterium excrementipullorum]|nr:hypothetical protein [Candidatus Aquabacterium excrementipullorum]
MRFVRTVGLVAAFAIATPIAQAAIVTLGFDLTPTSLSAASGAQGQLTVAPTQALSDAAPFSFTVQVDTDTLYGVGSLTTYPTPTTSFEYARSLTFSAQFLAEQPAYANAFNAVVPYEGGTSATLVQLARLTSSDSPAGVATSMLMIAAVMDHPVDNTGADQTQNSRLLSLNLPAYAPLASTDATPYLGDDATAWLQSLQGLTIANGFEDQLSLVQRRLILDDTGTSWVPDLSNQGIVSRQTITVTGHLRLSTVTVAVPEPAAPLLGAIGVLGLLIARRRLRINGA